MAVGPEFHDFLEPDGRGGLCSVEAVEGGEEDFNAVHHSRHVLRSQKGTPFIKHLRNGQSHSSHRERVLQLNSPVCDECQIQSTKGLRI